MKRTLIHNALIVNEGKTVQGSVVVENGRIAEVLTDGKPLSAPCDEMVDATGCYLLPGVIDDHVHFRDPGLTAKADIGTESRAAAAGGVTSIMDMPNTKPQTTTLTALENKLAALNERCVVNHSCYYGATNNNYRDFAKLDRSRVVVQADGFLDALFEQREHGYHSAPAPEVEQAVAAARRHQVREQHRVLSEPVAFAREYPAAADSERDLAALHARTTVRRSFAVISG